MNIFQVLTKKEEDVLLYEEGILGNDGRLTSSGRELVVDLMFQGNDISKTKSLIVEEIKKYRKNNK